MKSLVLTMSLLAGTLMGYSQTKVIDYPKIGYRSSEVLEFCQVEKSDTALILRGDVYNRPGYWVCVASSSVLKGNTTGKTYRLVRATGIELDKQVTMDESWTRSFSLQFEPVDPKDKSVDYFESLTGENGWVVEDISLEEKEKKGLLCHIEGQVVDNPAYSRLVLAPEGTDIRSNAWISIPVRDGKFAYDFYVERPAMYELYAWSDHMNGMMMPVPFLADKGQVNFTFYHIDKEAEWTSDISLNQELLRFNQEREEKFMIPLRKEEAALEAAGKVLTPEMMELRKQFDSAKTSEEKDAVRAKAQKLSEEGKEFTPEYLAFEEKSAKMMDEYFAYTLAYAESNPTLIGLGRLKEVTRWVERSKVFSAKDIISIYNKVYAGKFTGDATDNSMLNWILSQSLKVGDRFIDFTAPDAQGKMHMLSEEIKGKVALIDLWASWCGPCRRASMSMIPLYESYKDKGFTVVGVARERLQKNMESAIKKDGYPWLCLLELNDAGKIWEKYGVALGGGSIFMVDKEGKILAINPSAEEVKAILEKML